MAEVLKGAPVATAITERCAAQVEELKAQGIIPTLAILRVGEREDDLSYERGAMKRCASAGVEAKNVVVPADISQDEMLNTIAMLNEDPKVHGILMFRPLPAQLDEKACCEAILPAKDVDSANMASVAATFTGSGEGYPPCTPQACIEILHHYGYELKGKNVCVFGRSLVVGKPVAMMALAENATPFICHTKTQNTAELSKQADIVIAAVGRARLYDETYFSSNQVVIDVGINWDEEQGKLCGDVNYDKVEPVVSAITPVPGGVGSVTTAVLVEHVVQAAAKVAQK